MAEGERVRAQRCHYLPIKKIRKINSLIFGCLPQRRKNHAFSFFVSKIMNVVAGWRFSGFNEKKR
ncbi:MULTISPECIES: hypothetical protein [Enterobacterales]|uniref:hypothetical protein n=1 Tax=Enterobacterales TaxID=91347 RepID=UPI002EDB6A4B